MFDCPFTFDNPVILIEEGRDKIINAIILIARLIPGSSMRRLQQAIRVEAASTHAGKRHDGRMGLAWSLLMLHSGLPTEQVRILWLEDIDWEGKRVCLEQAKILKDRLVCLSQATLQALRAYLEVRGPVEALPEQAFSTPTSP